MGVRGLTSYIARHADLYLKPYELHDCNLVIDGDNLACNLYKDVTGICSAFGGDYDDFYRAVVEFFHVLAECNVRAYVLMDGGYEQKKLRTVAKRLRGKIAVIKRINPIGSSPIFPLMMREVFVDAVRDCGVPLMRCIFEADDELAALSRKLNCPVLSYDSDFYIHNVKYIPLVTLTVKAHTKRLKDDGLAKERKLRKCEAKHMEKRTKSSRILSEIQVGATEKNGKKPKTGKTYKYLDCCMYKIDNLIARGSLSKEKLPLFAALLGNDYIARTSFKNFFSQMRKCRISRKLKQQQRRITLILQWLKYETKESALEKILTRLRLNQRAALLAQVQTATEGYSTEKCLSYDFFVSNYEDAFKEFVNQSDEDDDEEQQEEYSDEDVSDDGEEEEEYEIASEEEECVDATEDEELKNVTEEEESENSIERLEAGDEHEIKPTAKQISDENTTDSEGDKGENEDEEDDNEDGIHQLPKWFLDKLYPGNLPRFFVDLMHMKIYINNPQTEHFPFNDCNELALPILQYIFTLLQHVKGEESPLPTKEDPKSADEAPPPTPVEFRYLTRATRVTNVQYKHIPAGSPPVVPFNSDSPDPQLFRVVFHGAIYQTQTDHLITQLDRLPADIRLYCLSIVYWLNKSQHCDLLHLHSLLICLVVLRTIDSKIEPIRDLKRFQKFFGKTIKTERAIRDKDAVNGVAGHREIRTDLKDLSPPDRMRYIAKSDCILVQDNLLKHFHMQEIFKKKYDSFSTNILHGFAEFQSVTFNLLSLNAILGSEFQSPRMAQSFCGVFLYNIYELLRSRIDLRHYVQNFIFRDSPMMFDFYAYLVDWCDQFVPPWKRLGEQTALTVSKKVLQKRKTTARKKAAAAANEAAPSVDPNAGIVDQRDFDKDVDDDDEDDFYDLNNKFCAFMRVQ